MGLIFQRDMVSASRVCWFAFQISVGTCCAPTVPSAFWEIPEHSSALRYVCRCDCVHVMYICVSTCIALVLVCAGAHAHLYLYNWQVLALTGTPSANAFGRWTRFHVPFVALKAPEKRTAHIDHLKLKERKRDFVFMLNALWCSLLRLCNFPHKNITRRSGNTLFWLSPAPCGRAQLTPPRWVI